MIEYLIFKTYNNDLINNKIYIGRERLYIYSIFTNKFCTKM